MLKISVCCCNVAAAALLTAVLEGSKGLQPSAKRCKQARRPSQLFRLNSAARASIAFMCFCSGGVIAVRAESDLVLYGLGTGEYDELNCKANISM